MDQSLAVMLLQLSYGKISFIVLVPIWEKNKINFGKNVIILDKLKLL